MSTPIKAPVWKGSQDLFEQPGYPRWSVDGNGTRIERRYEGPYEKVQAELSSGRAARGKIMPDLGAGAANFPIKTINYFPDEGGSGILSITLDNYSGPAKTFLDGKEGEPSYEEEWVELEKHVSTHPYLSELSDEDIAETVAAAENNEDFGALSASGSEEAAWLYKEVKSGRESYTLYVPVIRATTPYSILPPKGRAGQIEDPPSEAKAPDGWAWRKTAHRRMDPGQNSRYELVEEWTGAEEWDDIRYGPGSGLPGA